MWFPSPVAHAVGVGALYDLCHRHCRQGCRRRLTYNNNYGITSGLYSRVHMHGGKGTTSSSVVGGRSRRTL